MSTITASPSRDTPIPGRVVQGKEKALGPDHTSTLETINNLGILYADQGRLAEAEAMYERALQGREKALGPDHTSTLGTVNNLGNVYVDQGRLAEAEAMYERALQGFEKALGPSHPESERVLRNINSLQHTKDPSNATTATPKSFFKKLRAKFRQV